MRCFVSADMGIIPATEVGFDFFIVTKLIKNQASNINYVYTSLFREQGHSHVRPMDDND